MQNNNKTSRVNLLFPFFKFRAESICCSVERTLLVTFMSSNLSVDRVYQYSARYSAESKQGGRNSWPTWTTNIYNNPVVYTEMNESHYS
jgi:hypothetical protein